MKRARFLHNELAFLIFVGNVICFLAGYLLAQLH